jgi:thiamine-phosphate pyrophosphorylase
MGARAEPFGVLPIVDVRGRARDGSVTGFVDPASVRGVTERLVSAGARAIELRAKHASDSERLDLARTMRAVTRAGAVRLIINDRPDIALLADADAVHLGQTDLSPAEVRRWLPASIAIGVSCHSFAQARAAWEEGVASYLGFGPIYPTSSKQDPDPVVGIAALAAVCAAFEAMPVVAIGGISVDRLGEIRAAGASGAAMISGLAKGGDPAAQMGEAAERWG